MWIKYKIIIFWCLFIISIIFFSSKIIVKSPEVSIEDNPNIKLAFVGDIMLDRGVKGSVYRNFGGDYGELFNKVGFKLRNYDFLFGNLEGPVSDKGVDGGNIYSFRMEPVVVPALKEAGFDGFSLDNNHVLNFGVLALQDTKTRLIENSFYIAGEKNFVLGGVKFVILPFNEFDNLNLEQMKIAIVNAKLINDFVITYFHFGDEYAPEPNEYQKTVARLAIDSGADLVIGTHPHVIQTTELHKDKNIIYSLGNFIFDQNFSKETMEGGLLEVEVNPDTKLIEKVILKKVLLNSKFQIENII